MEMSGRLTPAEDPEVSAVDGFARACTAKSALNWRKTLDETRADRV
jgi:hypothetical protein